MVKLFTFLIVLNYNDDEDDADHHHHHHLLLFTHNYHAKCCGL